MSLEKCNTKTQRYEDTKSEDEISHQIIGASIEVHRTLGGPGLLESIYEAALCHELMLRGLRVHRQKPVQVVYKGVAIREPLFIDVVVDDKVLIEVKATEKNHPIYETQVLRLNIFSMVMIWWIFWLLELIQTMWNLGVAVFWLRQRQMDSPL